MTQARVFAALLVLSSLQTAFAARHMLQDPSINAAVNQQLQGAINTAQPLVNNFAQTVSNGLRNFNYSSIDWEKFANKVNSAANDTLTKVLPQPNVTAINEAAEKPFNDLNKTVTEDIPKFYDNFHWERPTLLNETINQLPLKEVVNQAINDQEPLMDRPEFYRTVNSLPVRPIFADAGVASFAQVRRHSARAPAAGPAAAPAAVNAPAPAPLDAVSAAVGTVLEGLNALAQGSPAAAPVTAALEQVAAAAAAPARAGTAQIMGPIATLVNTVTAGTPLNAALAQARSAVAATPVGAVVEGAQAAVGTAVVNSPIGAAVEGARTAAGPAIQSAQALAAAPVSTILQTAGSAIAGAPALAGPLMQAARAARSAAGPVAPLIENARIALAQAPVGPLMQAARTAVASSPLAGIASAIQAATGGRLPTLPGGLSNALQMNNFARAPTPAQANPFSNIINVTEVAQGFTQGLNNAINGGVPAVSNLITGNPNNALPSAAQLLNGLNSYTPDPRITRTVNQLMPSNPIDMVVNAINSNGGSATPVESTSSQSFVEAADGSLEPTEEASTKEDKTTTTNENEKSTEAAPEAAASETPTDAEETKEPEAEAATSEPLPETTDSEPAADTNNQ